MSERQQDRAWSRARGVARCPLNKKRVPDVLGTDLGAKSRRARKNIDGSLLDADAIATAGPEHLLQLLGERLQRAAQARFRHMRVGVVSEEAAQREPSGRACCCRATPMR